MAYEPNPPYSTQPPSLIIFTPPIATEYPNNPNLNPPNTTPIQSLKGK